MLRIDKFILCFVRNSWRSLPTLALRGRGTRTGKRQKQFLGSEMTNNGAMALSAEGALYISLGQRPRSPAH